MEYYICPDGKDISLGTTKYYRDGSIKGYNLNRGEGCVEIKKDWKKGSRLPNISTPRFFGFYDGQSFSDVKQCDNKAKSYRDSDTNYKFTSIKDSFGKFQSCSFEKYDG